MSEQSEKPALDLAAGERVVRVKFAGRTGRHFFKPITQEDWIEYVAALEQEMVQRGESWTPESKAEVAALKLWEKRIERVEGYPEGDWKLCMPLPVIAGAVALLQEVYVSEGPDLYAFSAERRTVVLEAAWNERVHDRLCHTFRVPSRDEQLAYKRVSISYFRPRGTKEQNVSRVRIGLKLESLCRLWDALIVEAFGYCGYSGLDEMKRRMDPLHKQAAVVALFEPPEAPAAEQAA